MDTACIRIKFTPLIKNISLKDSECCLEIIPELSYVTNIEKMAWKTGYEFIEYEVPMNYRIILKKVAPTNTDDGNKMYYSCVDLLNTSSHSRIELGSGDVSRIVSDNAIFKKLATSMRNNEKCKIVLTSDLTPVPKTQYTDEQNKFLNVESNEVFKEENVCVKSIDNIDLNDDFYIGDQNNLNISNTNAEKKLVSVQIQISKRFINENKAGKISGKEIDVLESKMIKPRSTETLTNFNALLEPKITLTSFFSFDTKFKPLLQTVYRNNSFCNSNIHCALATADSALKGNSNVIDKTIVNFSGNGASKKMRKDNITEQRFRPELKILPALRLSHYKQVMENELLPIRIKLNEIISKCIPLGLLQKSHDYIKTMGYGQYTNTCADIQNSYKEHHSTSNRVVYSVVFNK